MTSRAYPFVALTFVAVCAHASHDDARLKSRLALEPEFSVLHRDAPTDVVFTLRNTSSTSIEFCLVDSGVSLEVRGRDGSTRPLVVYTIVLHSRCHGRQSLAPGEVARLQQVVDAPRADLELPRGSVDMKACVRVGWPDRDTPADAGNLCSNEFKVTLRPQGGQI